LMIDWRCTMCRDRICKICNKYLDAKPKVDTSKMSEAEII